jgi:hypothetical protein
MGVVRLAGPPDLPPCGNEARPAAPHTYQRADYRPSRELSGVAQWHVPSPHLRSRSVDELRIDGPTSSGPLSAHRGLLDPYGRRAATAHLLNRS